MIIAVHPYKVFLGLHQLYAAWTNHVAFHEGVWNDQPLSVHTSLKISRGACWISDISIDVH